MSTSLDTYKTQVGEAAADLVEPGMLVGLGSGSTSAKFTEALGARVRDGLEIVGVPTSEATKALAERLDIPLTTLDDVDQLDLTVDGADEIDPELRLVKGGGGAHLREKIVAMASQTLLVIADHTKLVDQLGAFPLPIEVVTFGLAATRRMITEVLSEAGCKAPTTLTPRLGTDGQPFVTDSGNYILDAALGHIPDPDFLADLLEMVPGVVEHGLFIEIADTAIIASPDGLQLIEPA